MITRITIFALMVTIGSQPSYKRDEFDSLHLVVVEATTIDCASILAHGRPSALDPLGRSSVGSGP
jgi:hypothetical protein